MRNGREEHYRYDDLDRVDTPAITLGELKDTLTAFNKERGLVGGVPNEAAEIKNKIAILDAKAAQYERAILETEL